MFRLLVALAISVSLSSASAQPRNAPEQSTRAVSPYLYLMDSEGNKVLVSTQFWRNDQKYDDRTLHRFLDVMTGLEKRGFRKDDKAVIDDWDKPEPIARCYIYMEDLQAGKKTKSTMVTGSRVWCTDNGASEHEISPSDNPKHVDQVLRYFDIYLARAKKRLHEGRTRGMTLGEQEMKEHRLSMISIVNLS